MNFLLRMLRSNHSPVGWVETQSGRLGRDPALPGLCNVLGLDPAYELTKLQAR